MLQSVTRRLVRIRRVALVAAILAHVAVPANAGVFRLGGQFIGSYSSLTGDLPEGGSWESSVGPGAGIVAEFNLSQAVAIGLQPSYIQRGASEVFRSNGVVLASIEYDINYFSVPLVIRVTGDPVGTRGYVTAGLDFGFLIDATANSGSSTRDITDTFDSSTIGALMGAGVMVPVGRNFLTFEVRYVQGLQDIVARDDDGTNTDFDSPSVKYRGFDLLVAFLFSLGGE